MIRNVTCSPATSEERSMGRTCRLCQARLATTFVDLGMSPLCESFLTADQIDQMEPHFPLRVLVCDRCFLVQLQEYVRPESIFTEYAYFSSYATSWVEHARRYCLMIRDRLGLGPNSQVFEIASNDGYLLQHFLPLNIPVMGIEPAGNVAQAALNFAHTILSPTGQADAVTIASKAQHRANGDYGIRPEE